MASSDRPAAKWAAWLGLLLLGCGGAPSAPSAVTGDAPAIHYTITLDSELRTLSAVVCPRDVRIDRYVATTSGAIERVRRPRLVTAKGERPLEIEGDGVPIPAEMAGACLGYDIDLGPPREGLLLAHAGGNVLAAPDLWLLAPGARPAGMRVTASFTLPSGVRAALPWPEDPRGYRVPGTAFTMRSAAAFGRFSRETLPVEGAELDVVALGGGFGERGPLVTSWMRKSASALAQLHDGFPVERVMVLLLPEPGAEVGFGMALRGGGPTVMIMVGEGVTSEELDKDWTAVHELFHLSAPRFHSKDAWLSEGLATYYTEILRGRAGMVDEHEAWYNLAEGFGRGRRAGTGRSLRQESADMRETHAYHRVYWAGAAMAFLADVELRQKGVEGGLDGPLRALARCCARAEEPWSAERFAQYVDSATGHPVMAELLARYLDSAEFPDTGALLATFGIRGAGRDITVADDAVRVDLRRAMMAPRKKISR